MLCPSAHTLKKDANLMRRHYCLSLFLAAGACLAVTAIRARADLITDAGSLPTPRKVVDFSQFSGPFVFTSGPVPIGGNVQENIVFTSTSPFSLLGDGSQFVRYDLDPNGSWGPGRRGFAGLDAQQGTMTFTFNSGPVSAVGGFLNYSPDPQTDVIISALDSSGNVLASYDLSQLAPISTPGALDAGAFRGISLPTTSITAFQISNAFAVLDDLTFSRTPTPVPEPSAFVLFASCVGVGSGFLRRRATKRL